MEKIVKLKNGGVLIYSKSKLNNCSAVEVGFSVGAYNEQKIGTAHFCEHTLFKKTKNRDNLKIENDRNELVFLNAATSMDYMIINFFRSNRLINESMEFAEDVLMNSIIDDEYIETEKGVIKEELNMCLDSESRDVYVNNMNQAQTKARFSSDIVGKTSDNISKIKFSDLKKFKEKFFIGNNFIISVSSSLSLSKIKKLVNQHFVKNIPYNPIFQPVKSHYNDTFIDKSTSLSIIKNNQEKITILISFKVDLNEIGLINDYNYSILSKYFAGSQGDLFLRLRNKGLIYRLSSDFSCFKKDSLFNIAFETSREKIKEIIGIMKDDVLKIINEGIEQKYIDSYLKNIDYYNDEKMPIRMSSICHKNLIEYLYFGKLINITKKQRKKSKKNITSENIKLVARKIFNKNNKMFVTVLGNVTEEYVPTLKYFKTNFLIVEEGIIEWAKMKD